MSTKSSAARTVERPGSGTVIAAVEKPGSGGRADTKESGGRVLRIMHVTNSMAVGGTEKVVLRLATRLTDGFEHRICCVRNFDPDLVRAWLRPEQFSSLELPQSRFAVFVPQLVRAIRSCKPDVVHSRNWGAIESVFAARLAGVPVVIHSEHGYDVDGLSSTPLRQRWIRRMVCSAADAFFTVSRELRDFHATQAGVRAERIRVLYNGVDTHQFAPNKAAQARIRAKYGIGPDEFVVGAVGRAVAIKDYETLLRAVELLSRKHVGFKLLLVGNGPELPKLVSLAESLPGVRARFLPFGQRDDIPECLAAMDVFVLTSLREGMSNTVLEAMSTGLPAVVTRVGGNPEIVEDGKTGWLFKPGDVEHLAQLLHLLAVDRDLRKRAGQAARRRIEEMFSHETMLENYRTLYTELAQKRGVFKPEDRSRARAGMGKDGEA